MFPKRDMEPLLSKSQKPNKKRTCETGQNHTPGHTNCPGCLGELRSMYTPFTATMLFPEAADIFLAARATINVQSRIQYVAPRTYEQYEDVVRMLGQFFRHLRLDQIDAGHLRTYQKRRANGDGFIRRVGKHNAQQMVATSAGASSINRELATLKQIMIAAQAWTPQLQAMYIPLQEVDSDIPKALGPDEQAHFLATTKANPDWEFLYWYSLVALHTTFSSDEMRTLRQGDINLAQQIVSVNRRHGKNRHRRRSVDLFDGSCLWALEQLIERSVEMVGRGPQRHLFPFRISTGHYDGERSITRTGMRKPFEAARDKAEVPWFCLNGLRHTAITRMAEEGVPIAIIMSRAGHTSPKMTAHYTHISRQAERIALERGWVRGPVAQAAPVRRVRGIELAVV